MTSLAHKEDALQRCLMFGEQTTSSQEDSLQVLQRLDRSMRDKPCGEVKGLAQQGLFRRVGNTPFGEGKNLAEEGQF
jgi:hypothetical protein